MRPARPVPQLTSLASGRGSAGVDCSDIVEWHEGRFGEAGPDAKWQAHIEMFKPGGRYYDIEKILLSFVDADGYTGDGCDAFASYAKK